MIKKRWIKHLLASLCLLMAIPAFAQEKYWIRVSDYSDLLTREIDSVSNLCKLNPTYGAYATGEHTYPATLPQVGIYVQCSMENPNSTFKIFGMDVFCPKGFSHRSMVGIENGLEEGCYSQMTCEAAAKAGLQRPQECCMPIPITNSPSCDEAMNKLIEMGYPPPLGFVECIGGAPCAYPDHRNGLTDPQAISFDMECTIKHEQFHIDTRGEYGATCNMDNGTPAPVQRIPSPLLFIDSELAAIENNITCLHEKEQECCTDNCKSDMLTARRRMYTYQTIMNSERWKYCRVNNCE